MGLLGKSLPPHVGMPLRHYFGRDREKEIAFLKYFTFFPGSIVDVGSNRGTYAWPLYRIAGKKRPLVLIEVQAFWYEYLSRRFSKKANIQIIAKALSDSSGTSPIFREYETGKGFTGAVTFENYYETSQPLIVETIKLDDIGLDSCSFIKIDTDGHELPCLEGALKTLENFRPTLLIEIEYRIVGENSRKVFQRLSDLGYVPFSLYEGVFQQLDILTLDFQNLNSQRDGTFRNNFLFIHMDKLQIFRKLLKNSISK